MSTQFPVANDSFTNPGAGDAPNSPSHASQHANANDAIVAIETKLGTGASTPSGSNLLVSTGTGTSAWSKAAPTGTIVGTSDAQTLTNKILTSPTINTPTINNPTLNTDSISEYTVGNGVTVGGVKLKSGALATNNSVVTANIAAGAVTSAKIASLDTSVATISNPYKFRARRSTAYTFSAGAFAKITFATEDYDTNNNFDAVTNFRYTAPVNGFYHFDSMIAATNPNTALILALYKNGSAYQRGVHGYAVAGQDMSVSYSDTIQLVAGDFVEMFAFCSTAASAEVATAQQPYFSGYLVSQT